jgi:hypothetical protein
MAEAKICFETAAAVHDEKKKRAGKHSRDLCTFQTPCSLFDLAPTWQRMGVLLDNSSSSIWKDEERNEAPERSLYTPDSWFSFQSLLQTYAASYFFSVTLVHGIFLL